MIWDGAHIAYSTYYLVFSPSYCNTMLPLTTESKAFRIWFEWFSVAVVRFYVFNMFTNLFQTFCLTAEDQEAWDRGRDLWSGLHLLHVLSRDFKGRGDSVVSVHSAMCSYFGTWLWYLGYVLHVISCKDWRLTYFPLGLWNAGLEDALQWANSKLAN